MNILWQFLYFIKLPEDFSKKTSSRESFLQKLFTPMEEGELELGGNSSVDRVETRNCVSCCMWHAKRLVATACDSIHLPNKSLTATH